MHGHRERHGGKKCSKVFFFIRQCFVIKHWFGINTGKDGTVLTVSSWTNPSDLAP